LFCRSGGGYGPLPQVGEGTDPFRRSGGGVRTTPVGGWGVQVPPLYGLERFLNRRWVGPVGTK